MRSFQVLFGCVPDTVVDTAAQWHGTQASAYLLGEIIYATQGSGKTYVSNKYHDVIDFDDLIVQTVEEVANGGFKLAPYADPRTAISQYFRYIRFSKRYKEDVYEGALEKARNHCKAGRVVLMGTRDLLAQADRVFIQEDERIVRSGFDSSKEERDVDDEVRGGVPLHHIDDYLDNSLQQVARHTRG